MTEYIHGFSEQEQNRLYSQARFLEKYFYPGVDFKSAKKVLEIGCGVGAQTDILLRRFPNIEVTAVDASEAQLARAKEFFKDHPAKHRVSFVHATGETLPFEVESFDATFFCWVLEHVKTPHKLLQESSRVLKQGGQITAIEVQNSSLFVFPHAPVFMEYWAKLNALQLEKMGDPYVGSKLGNLLFKCGFKDIQVKPNVLHFEYQLRREDYLGFIKYWYELGMSAAPQLTQHDEAVAAMLPKIKDEFQRLLNAEDGVFLYTAFTASGIR